MGRSVSVLVGEGGSENREDGKASMRGEEPKSAMVTRTEWECQVIEKIVLQGGHYQRTMPPRH